MYGHKQICSLCKYLYKSFLNVIYVFIKGCAIIVRPTHTVVKEKYDSYKPAIKKMSFIARLTTERYGTMSEQCRCRPTVAVGGGSSGGSSVLNIL